MLAMLEGLRKNKQMKKNKSEMDPFVPSYLLYLLAASSDEASKQFHAVVRSKGLRVPEWRVIASLYDQDGLMTTKLAEYALAEQSRLTRILDQMDKKGLINRRTGKDDRRKVTIHLTTQGRELASQLIKQAREHEQKLLDVLEDTDASRLKPALQALLNKLKPSVDK